MRKRQRFWIAAVCSVVFLGAAAAIVQQKYEPLVPSPVVTHTEVATGQHTLRAVFYPPLAPGPLAGLAQLPEWVVVPLAPREIALLADPDLAAGSIRLQLFLNERILGPVIADYVTQPDLSQDVPFVKWDARGFVREDRGSMLLQGEMPITEDTARMIQALYHPEVAPLPPAIKGGHMLELALINNDGGAVAVLLTLFQHLNSGPAPFDPAALARNLEPVAELRASADFTSEDTLEATLTLTGRPGTEQKMQSLAFLTEVARGKTGEQLWNSLKIGLSGDIVRDGCKVVASFKVSGLSQFFRGEEGDA